MTKLFATPLVITLALALTAPPAFGQRRGGGGGARSTARTNVNSGAGANRAGNVNANRNVNVNQNVAANRNVYVNRDVDVHGHGGYYGGGYGCCFHPVAAGAAFAATAALTAVAIGSVVNSLPPSCSSVVVNTVTYQQCGSTWYQPQFSGSSTTYVVVNPPQ
jgi:hypothetical protein